MPNMVHRRWPFVGEGGKHALFAADEGHLLRIRKDSLALSALEPLSIETKDDNEKDDPLEYLQTVVAPRLSPYMDVPEKVDLDWDLLRQLRDSALAQGGIPLSRSSSWLPRDNKCRPLHPPCGLLLVDYRRGVALECKPKAGYRAFSPLVDPRHRIKYRHSRFSLLQHLYANGHIDKPWVASRARRASRSTYEPLDLFSQDRSRIRASLQALAAGPQNNLRLWVTAQLVLGHDCPTTAVNRASDYLQAPWMDVTVEILTVEPFLARLLACQRMDALDADGAVLVYDRLAELCGDGEQAEQLIDQRPWGADSLTITKLLQEVEHFEKLLLKSNGADFTTDMEQSRERALAILKQLDKDECAIVLQRWLFSLAMNDLSFFLTIEKAELDTAPLAQRAEPTSRVTVIRQQSTDAPGLLKVRLVDGSFSLLTYRLKVIDCDRKPASKLRDRRNKEALFQLCST